MVPCPVQTGRRNRLPRLRRHRLLSGAGVFACLHVLRYANAKNLQRALQLLAEEVGHPEQENFAFGVRLSENRVLVIEVVECLCELEGVLERRPDMAAASTV